MEYQKIINLLSNTSGTYNINSGIRFKTARFKTIRFKAKV